MLVCYRPFKEARNALIHRGGVAAQRDEDASREYELLTAQHLGMRRKPALPTIRVGQPIRLSMSAIVGLSEVLLRVTTTVDVELGVTPAAEDEIWKRWVDRHGKNIYVTPNQSQMAARLRHYAQHAHVPPPSDPFSLVPWLEGRGIRFLR